MKRLEQLPEVANRQLGGLTATSTLLAKAKRSGSPAKSALSMAAVISCIGTSPSTGKTCCSSSCV